MFQASHLFENPQDFIQELQNLLGFQINTAEHYHLAFLHSSKTAGKIEWQFYSNERLEFLGDSIVNMWTTSHLYDRYPEVKEGVLSKRKSILVSSSVLGPLAQTLGLSELICASKAEMKIGARSRKSVLANVFESLVGAIFLDQGIEACHKFLQKEHFPHWDMWLADPDLVNYKSILLEYMQSKSLPTPEYILIAEEGPDHEKVFEVKVLLEGVESGLAKGQSKKKAEILAARLACAKVGAHG